MRAPEELPDKRDHKHKNVVCPVCGKRGTLIPRQRGKQLYYYIQHRQGGKLIEHYVGPAQKFEPILEDGWPSISVYARITKESASVGYLIPDKIKEKLHDIRVLRCTMLEYVALLMWLKELVENEMKDIMRSYGIKEEEATEWLRKIKERYVTLTLYKKIY